MSKINKKLPEGPLFTRRAALAALAVAAAAVSTFSLPAPGLAEDKKELKVGIISGEDEDVWRVVTAEAAKKGLTIEAVVFNDYTQPNEALARGEIDANAFQHLPYLENQVQQHGYKIVPVGYTAVWPIGLYSKKHAKVAELPDGAVVGVPNDPSNEGRALRVLQNEGLIKLKDGTGILATIADIASSPGDRPGEKPVTSTAAASAGTATIVPSPARPSARAGEIGRASAFGSGRSPVRRKLQAL